MITFTIVTHYSTEDPDCSGEYFYVDIVKEGQIVATFGDHYHDKGIVRATSWVEGYKAALKEQEPHEDGSGLQAVRVRLVEVADAIV